MATPTPPAEVRPGVYAYVAVSAATGWRNPGVVRAVDAPALANPVRMHEWLTAMNYSLRADLIDRADTQVLLGDQVLVLAVSGDWAQVIVPSQATPLDARGYPAWIPVRQLTTLAPPSSDTVATVTTPTAWLHSADGAAALEVGFGTRLPVLQSGGTRVGVGLPGGRDVYVDAGAVIVTSTAGAPLPPTAEAVLASARRFLGLAYLWAGTSGFGYDCSGLTYTVYRAHGILLPRDADAQAKVGRSVERTALRPGDLVFFGTSNDIHHVGIYTGNGLLLDSPQTGSAVEVVPLATYPDYFSARRVLP